jgi:hypothetical protein
MLFTREWSWSSKPMPQPWHSICLGLVALGLFAAGGYGYKQTRDFLRSAQRSTGVVVAVVGKPGETTYPRVRFADAAGRTHEFASDLRTSPPRYAVGEQVVVLYPADAPERAQIEGFEEQWFVPMVDAIIGVGMAAAAILTWIFRNVLFEKRRRA